MGNDNEINKDLIDKTKSKFLPEKILDKERKDMLYSLEDEFAKSKKNRNFMHHFYMLLFVAVLVSGTLLYTYYLEKSNKNFEINIKEFDDLRLKEALNSARKKENSADILTIQLDFLQIRMLDAILEVKTRHYNREMALVMRNLPDADIDAKIKSVRDDERRATRRARARYTRLIRDKKNEIEAATERMLEDQEELKKAGEINNEDKLYSMRVKKLKEEQQKGTRALRSYLNRYTRYLTLKYNPRFRSGEINGIIRSNLYQSQAQDKNFNSKYQSLVSSDRPYARWDYKRLKKRIENFNLLIKRILKIPYINSVDPALNRLDFLSRSIIYDFERQVRKRDQEIKNFRYAFDYILNKKPESGYIIDSRNKDNIKFHMYRVLKIKSGETAKVFRDEDQFIGKIQFIMRPYGMRAKTIMLDKDMKIRPFDKILLEIKDVKKEQP